MFISVMTNSNFRQNFLIITLAFLLFIGFNAILILPLQPVGTPLESWDVTYNGETRTMLLPFCLELSPGVNMMTLATTFSAFDGDTLILPQIMGNAVEIRLNHERVYKLGDLAQPTANLWNNHLTIPFTQPLRDQNDLEITIASSIVSIGLGAVPSLAPYPIALQRSELLNWLYSNLIWITSGATGIVGFILLLFCFIRKDWRRSELYIGLALLLSSIFNLDTVFRETTGSLGDFLWFEKFVVSAGYLAAACLIFGLVRRVQTKGFLGHWVIWSSFISCLILFLCPDLYWFNIINGYTTILQFINLLIFCGIVFISPKTSRWMLVATLFLTFAILQMAVSVIFHLSMPLTLPYAISLSAIVFGVNLVLDFNHLAKENLSLKIASKLDPLTEVMNRRGILDLDPDLYQFIAMVDLDSFKNLNDRYGHARGDEILINFTNAARKYLRQGDLVARWGGDEFLLAFANIPHEYNGYQTVENIIQRILFQYSSSVPDIELTFSFGIAEIRNSFEESMKEADTRMYAMKHKNKDNG